VGRDLRCQRGDQGIDLVLAPADDAVQGRGPPPAGRIQHSVFIATTEPGLLNEALERISPIINPGTDSVYVFRQCAACWEAIGVHGQAAVAGRPLYWAVL